MFCAISGQACADPVVSRTGYIFERRLIETYVEQHGTCPVSGEPLTKDDLFAVKQPPSADGSSTAPANVAVTPKPPTATSIPSLLKSLQTEFDAAMLETHSLKVQNASLRQEMSRALYQHDAACRVVARLMSEKEQLKREIDVLKAQVREAATAPAPLAAPIPPPAAAPPAQEDAMDVDRPAAPALPADVVAEIEATSEQLSKTRKKRKTPDTATVDQIKTYASRSAFDVTYAGVAHLAAVQPVPTADPTVLALAGKSKGVALYEYSGDHKHIGNLPIKQTKVTALAVLQHDATAPVFAVAQKDHLTIATVEAVVAEYTAASPIVGISAHPSGKYVAAAVLPFDAAAHGTLTQLAFSENGFHLATAAVLPSGQAVVHIWDLRKIACTATLPAAEDAAQVDAGVLALAFDYTGGYLAVGLAGGKVVVYVYASKQWSLVTAGQAGDASVGQLVWGPHAKFVLAASVDSKHVTVWGLPQTE
ncbi:hypothetical protein AMAG_03759 [Allomyces macrogynus ATCC 38327]|uniref:Pre-mRNA-processing factor 19 n=1 Tax=Allomyces macrogynus (strain ATCC 38327) TaxID=578462 RepID=A0A0L0SAS7_ALLM3|nr:hypothetical protein AMAG_03759 [Allomyces macrogynus ATCC 38327]|eukprot:KNE59485.1 hypothetical protein AMAG_03759 [Allomyces macrogynus ATCC 38327]